MSDAFASGKFAPYLYIQILFTMIILPQITHSCKHFRRFFNIVQKNSCFCEHFSENQKAQKTGKKQGIFVQEIKSAFS